MKISSIFYSISILQIISALLFSSKLNAQLDQETTITNIKPPVHNSTAFINLKPIDCTTAESSKISSLLKSALPAIPYIVIINQNVIKQAETWQNLPKTCDSINCAAQYGRIINSHMVITGSVMKIEKEKENLMGEEGKYKYLLHKKADITYKIKIILYNAVKKTELIAIQRISKESELNQTINYIADKLKPYFLPPLVIKPVEKKLITSLNIQAEYLVPCGKYSEFADKGYGISLYGGLCDFFFKKSAVSIFLSFAYFVPESNGVKNYSINKTGIQILYGFSVSSNYSLLPGLSGGYMLHHVSTKTEGFDMYWDPFIQAELNLRKHIRNDIYIQAGPSYILFFEKENSGHAIEGHVSVVLLFK
ncbi:MAG: hypothetical protein V1874_11100 [Spirochaetota bacterium]